jgi:hypothetical protein
MRLNKKKTVARLSIGGGIVIRIPYISREIWDKMNRCDRCGFEGEICGWDVARLFWVSPDVLCGTCKGD